VGASRCCDPNLFVSYGWSNAVTPLNYTVVSGVRVERTHQTAVSAAHSQGFLTCTGISVSEASTIHSSNTTTGIYNPESVSSLSAGLNQHLLKGFGAIRWIEETASESDRLTSVRLSSRHLLWQEPPGD
jgi:hypothetical protein